VEDRSDQSARATAPSCSVSKLEQTSPTAGEPAVSSRIKSVSPTSTKKAWRQRLEMDAALAASGEAPESTKSQTSSTTERKPPTCDSSAQLEQSQLFVCRHCGKYFITLKYLEMHSALHAASSTVVHSQPTAPVSSTSFVHSHPLSLTRRPAVATLDQPPPRPAPSTTATSFSKGGVPVLPPPTTCTPSAPSRYRDWTCDICRKKFSQNSSYKNHQRTHSDERPFVCTVCSIGFKERYHLKKHTLFKHSNETREECRVCGKRFKG